MEEKAGKMLHKGKAEIPSKDSMCLCLSSAQETNCKDQKETLGDKRQPITGNLQENRELFPISTLCGVYLFGIAPCKDYVPAFHREFFYDSDTCVDTSACYKHSFHVLIFLTEHS